jgi:O-antigen/teichoic acid export membrane protein
LISKLKNRDFNLSLLTVAVTISLQFLFIRYASYSITKVDYGNFVLLQTLIAGLSAVLLQMPGQSFDRFYNQAKVKSVFVNEFRTMLIFINIISLLLIVLYDFFYSKFSFEILLLLFLYFVLLNNYALNQKVFLLNMQRGKYFYLKLFESSARFLFPALFYLYFQSLESLIYGISTGYLVAHVVLRYFLKGYVNKFTYNWVNLKKYFLFSYPIVFVSLFTWGISFSDRYFIDYFLSTEDVAIYSLLAMVAGVGQVVGQVYFMYAEPKILKHFADSSESTYSLINAYILRLFFVFVVLSVIALFIPKYFYTILLEESVVNNERNFASMMILLVAIFINILHIAYHMHLKLMARLDVLAFILFIAFFINFIGNFYIAEFGIIAAAVSTLVSYIFILVLQFLFVYKQKHGNYKYG